MRHFLCWVAALLPLPLLAAERIFNFSEYPLEQTPPGFRSIVAGMGKPGEWKVITDEVSPSPALSVGQAPGVTRRVLAQTARDPQERHFPMLIFDGETYGDFKLTTRFKIVGGALEQTAGIVFRFQNESNFYIVGASALGKNFRCYKVENGVAKPPFGPDVEITKGIWHDLTVQCEGPRISCTLDGKEAIKLIDNTSAGSTGKVGFWTRSDSVSHFVDARITYTQPEALARALVRDALKEYPRLLGLKIFAVRARDELPSIVASKDEKEINQAGGTAEAEVISHGTSYYSRDKDFVAVTLPLRDRNGDPIAAVRVVMKTFPGQTEGNAVLRAKPVVKQMQSQVQSLGDLLR